MKAFLEQVAQHYYASGDSEHLCFIFPNRRSLVFFKKYFGECVAGGGEPVVSPYFCTMNDFFYQIADASQTGQVNQLIQLYECYCELNPQHESLDEFIFWGGILLSDFNDVDKYLVKAESIFQNVAEFRDMQDDMNYLNDTQKEAIMKFIGHFKNGGKYKDEFRKIWDILLPLYRSFNSKLSALGLSYEGQVYRKLAERLGSETAVDVLRPHFEFVHKFIFVGLNALNECEKLLMRRLRDAGLAEFCWDFSSEWIKAPQNKSSFFLAGNISDFPQAFELDTDGLGTPAFNVISVPSSTGQAKQLPSIFRQAGSHGIETAVVLPDESLLLPVLNSIPEEIGEINVTMGYPMKGSGLWSLMNDIAALQLHLRFSEKDGKWCFYHKQVWEIFSNSIFRTIAGEDGTVKMAAIRKEAHYYISEEELSGNPVFELVFRAILKNPSSTEPKAISDIEDYQSSIISGIAPLLKDIDGMSLELDFAREYFLAIGQLRSCSLAVLPATYFRLLDNLVGKSSVPFKGEPLKGLQIMGPLETRALDFDNVIVLSCNEGIFPRRSVSSSFIPQELRKGFDLPTYEYQDAVWAYYFYRLVQRAENVWLLFDSRTEGVRSGEESRYIKQLELDFNAEVKRYVVKSEIIKSEEASEIVKTAEDIQKIRSCMLSASALQNYLTCPARFYYSKVCGLSKEQEVAEFLDGGAIGTVFHETMQQLYSRPDGKLTAAYLKSLSDDVIKDRVRQNILDTLHTFEVTGRNIIFEDMVCKYVRKIVQMDLGQLEDSGRGCFEILGLEKKEITAIDGFNFVGYVDRIDSISPGEIRIIDYKTGKVKDEDFVINEGNAQEVVDALFGDDNSKRPKIALQLYLYDRIVAADRDFAWNKMVNSIYQPMRMFVSGVEIVELSPRFNSLMDEKLSGLLAELVDPETPFRRIEQGPVCDNCDFKIICGR